MLGIDTSKDYLVCALYDKETESFRWERSFRNTPAGVLQLLAGTPPDAPWVLEPTGRYSLLPAKLAREAGRKVLLAPPKKAKCYLRSIQSRAKNDRLDGRGLALFAASRPACEPLEPYPIKSEAVDELDQLLTARRGIVDALTSLRQRVPELPHAAPLLKEAIEALKKPRAAVDAQIAAHTAEGKEFSEVSKLREVHGIGPVTAAAAVSRLKSKQFRTPDEFVAYIGLDVVVHQSGRRTGKQGLSKQGDAELRRLFYLCGRAAITAKNSPFRAQYERERAKGMPATAAFNAVARKLARLCWSLVKHKDSKYDPNRVYQQGRSAKAAE